MRKVAMSTIVADVLMRKTAKAQASERPFAVVLLFCGLGLLASLGMSLMGFDVSGGGF
jgi:hypothetical protein